MLFSEIVERLSKGLDPSRLSDVLKFDCGQDGVVTLGPNGVGTVDQDADCTIAITTENLAKLLAGKLNPMTGVMTGKLKISGNPAVAMKLGKLLG